jgi:capsid protein
MQMKAEQPSATFKEFTRAQSSEQARPLNMPQNIAAADSSGYSFSGGKLDHLTYFVSVDVEQEEIEEAILDPLFEVWFAEAVLRFGWGVPNSPLPLHGWDWPRKPVIDEAKTSNARKTDLSTGVASLRRLLAEDSLDIEEEIPAMAKDYGVTEDEVRAALFKIHLGGGASAQPSDQQAGDQGDEPAQSPPQPRARNRLPAAVRRNGN